VLAAPGEPRSGRSWWPAGTRRRSGESAPPAPLDLREIAELAVGSFRSQVLGTRCGKGPDRDARVHVVHGLRLPTRHPGCLEVWVLLGDVDEDRVPAHWDPTEVLADVYLTSWALGLRGALLGHLTTSRWPDPYQVTMRVDAADRVERRGGRAYLLGSLAA
jgi:hypothetical protein